MDPPTATFDSFDLSSLVWMSDAPVPSDLPPVDQGHQDDLIFPPDDLGELLDLARFIEDRTEPGLLIGVDGEQIPLPREVYRVLQQAVDVMRQGRGTLVAPQRLLLTHARRLPSSLV